MSAPEPSWCTRLDHDQFPNLHRSAEIRVGPERHRGRGQVTVYLEAADGGPDAVVLRDRLTKLIKVAARRP